MKLTDVFLFIMYGMAAGYVIYFVSYIYNKSTRDIVYNQAMPVYSETVLYPWMGGGYNWYPYWNGWWSGGSNGGYNHARRHLNDGHIGNYVINNRLIGNSPLNNRPLNNRPWGDGGRGSNGGVRVGTSSGIVGGGGHKGR